MCQNRWLNLCNQIKAQGNPEEIYQGIITRYSETHRAYHVLDHILSCLKEFDSARHLAKKANEVEMAIWLHDVIYDVQAKDNEERSAEYAVEVCGKLGLTDKFAANVKAHILGTTHREMPTEPDTQLVVDCDLSSLALEPDEFDENTKNVRREYHWIPEKEFNSNIVAMFTKFLGRPSIFTTEFFRSKYEQQARINLQRIIDKFS